MTTSHDPSMGSTMASSDGFRDWNEKMARKYDPEAYHRHPNPMVRWVEHQRVRTIVEFLAAKEDDHVLEVGCGAGNILEQVPCGWVFGVDLSTFLIDKATRRLASRGAFLCNANGETLPFEPDSFEKVICSEVLEHVPRPRILIQEMVRVSKPGATIVLSVPNEPLINRLKNIVTVLPLWDVLLGSERRYKSPRRMDDEWHLHDFDLSLLRQSGRDLIQILRAKGIPNAALPLRYVAECRPVSED